jgi:hypothetical protein
VDLCVTPYRKSIHPVISDIELTMFFRSIMDATRITVLTNGGVYLVDSEDMSFLCPSKNTHVSIMRSTDLSDGRRAVFTRANENSLFIKPDGKFSDSVSVLAGETLDLGFDGGKLQVTGPALVYSMDEDGFITGHGDATWTWVVPEHTVVLDDGNTYTRKATELKGVKSFKGFDSSFSQSQKHDTLTIEVPHSQTGLNSLRIQGEIVKFKPLPGFPIRDLNIVKPGDGTSTAQ